MLLFFILLASLSPTWSFTLCEYYDKIGVFKPECHNFMNSPRMSSTPMNQPVVADIFKPKHDSSLFTMSSFASIPVCRNYFHSCMSSTICESGTICSSGVGPGSCCTDPNRSRCPSVTAMNINCRKSRGVNWCNSDSECRGSSTMASMCCPTGCNYNMCVHVGFEQPAMNLFSRNLVFSSLGTSGSAALTCPDPYLLNVKCVSQRPTSWCLTDSECPQNSLHPRKCCTTICGYNTCVVRYNGLWQIA